MRSERGPIYSSLFRHGLPFGLAICAMLAEAKPVSKAVYNTAQFGFGQFSELRASQERESRSMYQGTYLLPIQGRIRAGGEVIYVPDSETYSERLQVRESHLILAPTVEYSMPALVRIIAAAAPTYMISSTTYDFDGSGEEFSNSQLGLILRGGLDYQPVEAIEISGGAGLHYRFTDQKIDWMFGLRLGINIDAF